MRLPTLLVLALATMTFPAPASADEVVNEALKFRIGVPADFKIRGQEKAGNSVWYQNWKDVLVEIRSDDNEVGGMVLHSKTEWTSEKILTWREGQLKKGWTTCEKLTETKYFKRPGGDWLRADFTVANDKGAFHRVHLFCQNGGQVFELMIWCYEKLWPAYRESVEEIADTMQAGDGFKPPAPATPEAKPEPKPEPKPEAKGGEAVIVKVPDHLWKGFGVGSRIQYRITSKVAGTTSETRMTSELLQQGESSYRLKVTTELAAFKSSQEMVFEVEKPKESGAAKPAGTLETGTEKITVPAGEFECKWTKTTLDSGWSKAWTCDQIPGQVVKTVSEFGGTPTTMELVEFVKK